MTRSRSRSIPRATASTTAAVLRDLFDAPGSEGAFFDQGSAAYSLACVATGRVDAFVDIGRTIVDEIPEATEAWRRLGDGHVLNTTTYDTAAGYLVAREAGGTITDGTGGSYDDVPLFDADGKAETVATVAAATTELHAAAVEAVARGIDRLRDLVTRIGTDAV